jgi:NAD(P)-dependent dehydrogenase (short-subunit alcohol dehydrogenase family)
MRSDQPISSGYAAAVAQVVGLNLYAAPSVDGGCAHYGAAKAGIAHYTRYLAQDLGPFGITVNCIAPGVIATGRIMATVIPGSAQSNRDGAELVALRRLGTVEDCAKVVEFLATDLSDYVTGAVIPIEGGLVRGKSRSPTMGNLDGKAGGGRGRPMDTKASTLALLQLVSAMNLFGTVYS